MRLSRDKVNKLAHAVTDAVAELDEVEFIEDRNTIRLEVRKILEGLLMQEAQIDRPRVRKSKVSAAPSSKARKSGTSSTASTTTRPARGNLLCTTAKPSGVLGVLKGASKASPSLSSFTSAFAKMSDSRVDKLL